MDYKDYYRIMGVERDATEKDIKQAFRTLARQYHPDVNPDSSAENRFKEINEAYTVLSDPEKRRRYDELGSSYQNWERSGKRSNGFDWSSWTQSSRSRVETDQSSGRFSDFFNSIFGAENPRRTQTEPYANKSPIRGADQEMDLAVSLEEAYAGATKHVGRGNRSFTAHVPPGVQTGTRIRFPEQGERGFAGGAPGDLYITITVSDHPKFERRGDDLHTEIDVPLYTAVLGGEVRVPMLNTDVRLRVPANTQSGQTIRLKGRGMPLLRQEGQFGDLYARVLIKIPDGISPEEQELFRRLADLHQRRSY